MKVRDLLEVLKAQDLDAEVCIITSPHWPMEHAVGGAVVRGDLIDAAVDSDADAPLRFMDGASRSDVVLVEGRWLRYGSRAPWTVPR